MKLVFDNLEELHAFYGEAFGDSEGSTEKPKRTRRSKKDDAGEAAGAPAPMAPPAAPQASPTPAAFSGFAPPAAGAGPGPGFAAPVAAAPAPAQPAGPSSEVVDLVQRIVVKLDAALAGGQPQEAALAWFRTECGPNAAQATFDQVKTHHLFQQPLDKLAHIAKVMNA